MGHVLATPEGTNSERQEKDMYLNMQDGQQGSHLSHEREAMSKKVSVLVLHKSLNCVMWVDIL